MDRLPGWDNHSYGYHGDDGCAFKGSGKGNAYGPTFSTGAPALGPGPHLAGPPRFANCLTRARHQRGRCRRAGERARRARAPRAAAAAARRAGDVIGVLFNRVERCISFLKNGIDLGVAFGDVPLEERLYPCVGMRTPEEEARPPPRLPDARTRLRRTPLPDIRMPATASCTAYVRAAVCRTARLPWCMLEAEALHSRARHPLLASQIPGTGPSRTGLLLYCPRQQVSCRRWRPTLAPRPSWATSPGCWRSARSGCASACWHRRCRAAARCACRGGEACPRVPAGRGSGCWRPGRSYDAGVTCCGYAHR
jgi:hypothetical protein